MGLTYAKFHPSAAIANGTCSHSGGRSVPECYSTALGPIPPISVLDLRTRAASSRTLEASGALAPARQA
jgi:hypothetical protein